MCGVTGFWLTRAGSGSDLIRSAQQMAGAMSHRGPDDAGAWADPEALVALAHRRLSILDLSPAGAQPMRSRCERFVIVYNGEIYNHLELRECLELEGHSGNWRGRADTETLLAGLSRWGVEGCLRRLNGMFAFVVWDQKERALFLARDRMGEKPLYYGHAGDTFLFGSELKALAAHPSWKGEVDRGALARFIRFGYVPAPASIYHGISKLLPGHFLEVRDGGRTVSAPKCYWDLPSVAAMGVSRAPHFLPQLTDELDGLLRDAVGRRMMADVPLGAFLSGGIDSTAVVAQMQAQSMQPVRTFTIGFGESDHNEAEHAQAIATHLGTDHTELYVTPEAAMAVIPRLPQVYDEPFGDSSQIPTFLVSELARAHVTVSLSGDGGDELFAGYNRYNLGYNVWRKLGVLPQSLRAAAAFALEHAPGHALEKLQRALPPSRRVSSLPDRLPKLAAVLRQQDGWSFYGSLVSPWDEPSQIVLGADSDIAVAPVPEATSASLGDFRNQMMLWDQLTYLPDDILTKVDRASMAVSLEARVPFLDHRLVEFAWGIPLDFKVREGQGKWILRKVLDRYIPRALMERPKQGFGVPIEHWLRGPLRPWAESLLDERRLKDEGFFNPGKIRKRWEEHLRGSRRWHYALWNVLMFQAWREHWAVQA